jgi:tetratricopeptide (TPR) repeat protein
MNGKLKSAIMSGKAISRADVLTILQIALMAGEARFVRTLSEDWLNSYPYDLHIELLRARALTQEGKTDTALLLLKRLVELDPEFLEAQDSLARLARRVKPDIAERARASAAALANPSQVVKDIQAWGQALISAQIFFAEEKYAKAETEIQAALINEPPSPLPALLHLQIARKLGLSWQAINNLVTLYREQWPNCIQLRLQDAALLMESGQEKEALDLLHGCVAEDVSGQVARRLWGEKHRFSAMWPNELNIEIDLAIPAKVAAGLGWNHLHSGIAAETKAAPDAVEAAVEQPKTTRKPRFLERVHSKAAPTAKASLEVEITPVVVDEKRVTLPETLVNFDDIKTDADSLRLQSDGRYPAYVVLTTRAGLEKQYGLAGLNEVDAAMKAVVTSTAADPNWDAHLVYADDEESVSAFGLTPVKADDAWAIKHLVADLDEALRKKGEMIGALMIVGGPHIVPFHHLPNPVDDDDKDVPSDNPYASIDENYFMPTWPIGRLPNGINNDPTSLVKALKTIALSRKGKVNSVEGVQQSAIRALSFLGLWKPNHNSFGYTAEIWRRASHSVYRSVGNSKMLSISPPTETGRLPKEAGKAMQAAYFNLHGLEDTAEWYGQRDPQTTPNGPDYPVALRTTDIVNSGRAPQIVYTEACYGAHIAGKTADSAIALKFLESGSKAVVGSTVTSYGSVTTPLIAADLLGQTFWKLLNEGYPVGEALRRAKIAMAHTMHRRQGYLDGEDQKTLIAFVLYGDPLAQARVETNTPKRMLRPDENAADFNAVCDRTETRTAAIHDLPAETLATVKSVVQEYLPGMQGSQASISHEHLNCDGHNCNLPHHNSKAVGLMPSRSLVTLSKKVQGAEHMHPHYARITMDAQGKVVKLAVSR